MLLKMDEKTVKNAAENPKVLRQAVATLNAESFGGPSGSPCRRVKCGDSTVKKPWRMR
jgi:hypothetical protein